MGDWQTVVQYNEEDAAVRDVRDLNATLPKAPLQGLAAAAALFNATRKCIRRWEKDMRRRSATPSSRRPLQLLRLRQAMDVAGVHHHFHLPLSRRAPETSPSAFGALTEATVGAAVCEAAFEPEGMRPVRRGRTTTAAATCGRRT